MAIIKVLDSTTTGPSLEWEQATDEQLLKVYASAGDGDWGGSVVRLEAKINPDYYEEDIFTPTGVTEIWDSDNTVKLKYKQGIIYRLAFVGSGNNITAIVME